MGAFFTIGEKKIRPGVYNRYENYGTLPAAGADDGKCAAVLRSNWGPLGQAVTLEETDDIVKYFGDGGEGGTTDCPLEQFKGGARRIYAVRLGTGGTPGTYEIKDTADTAVLKLATKYPGSREFNLTIRPTIADANKKELIVLEGTTQLEKIEFAGGGNEVTALMAAVNDAKSGYITLAKLSDSDKALAAVDQAAITPGTDPAVTNEAYSAAFEVLEAHRWNGLAIDTDDLSVIMVAQLYLNRLLQGGKFVYGVFGEPASVAFETRCRHASAFNDYQVIYVGNGYIDLAGVKYEGWKAAARVCGLVAGTPGSESITHAAITGAVELTETLTNAQYEQAIKSGMLTFSTSAADTVWVEQGINTLVLPGTTEDVGWKNIKRVKVRFELMQRINDTVEPLIGRINNDGDGRMTVIQVSNGVCNSMVAEKKLDTGAHVEQDPDNAPQGDSAWFLIYADDIDALEKVYLAFKFRFAPDAA